MQLRMPTIDLGKRKENGISGTVDEVRRMMSDGAEQVADQVAKVAEQLGAEAGKVGHDVTAEATKLGKEWRASGEEGLRNLGKDVRALSKDVRKLRVTKEPAGPNMMPGIALLAGLGGGLAVMYFYDPEQGRRRRALLRDQLGKWNRVARERLTGQAEDLRNRTMGVTHEARTAFEDTQDDLTDEMQSVADTPDVSEELAETDQAIRSEVGY